MYILWHLVLSECAPTLSAHSPSSFLLTLLNSSADSLEEVVGLDIGYMGGHPRRNDDLDAQMHSKMDEYLKEYEHRKREKAYIKKVEGARRISKSTPLSASSVHQESLHGNSYHGRRIITSQMIESLDTTGGNHVSVENGNMTITAEEPESANNPERRGSWNNVPSSTA